VALCATLAGRLISNFRFCIFKRSPLENLLHAQQIREKRGRSREFKFNWVVLHNSYINVCGLTRCRRPKFFCLVYRVTHALLSQPRTPRGRASAADALALEPRAAASRICPLNSRREQLRARPICAD
jgi:hypothetical protein